MLRSSSRDPIIQGPYSEPPNFGNSQMEGGCSVPKVSVVVISSGSVVNGFFSLLEFRLAPAWKAIRPTTLHDYAIPR